MDLNEAEVAISIGGVGRAIDNVFIERSSCTLKYGHISSKPAENAITCLVGIASYWRYGNGEWPHSSLRDAASDEVYYEKCIIQCLA